MKYSVEQKVKIRSLEWYRDNVNRYGIIECGKYEFFEPMNEYCGKVVTIKRIDDDNYRIDTDKGAFCWTDEMIEGLVEEETASEKILEARDKHYWDMLGGESKNEITLPQGYQFVDENGNVISTTKIVLEKKKKCYPKTYAECCKVLQYGEILKIYPPSNADVPEYDVLGLFDSLEALRKLRICRDAYWKIAGEEMGLKGPWEPDWDDDEWPDMYYISWSGKYLDKEKGYPCCNMVLIFPTEEMRDAFYENFKELIEQCKELL